MICCFVESPNNQEINKSGNQKIIKSLSISFRFSGSAGSREYGQEFTGFLKEVLYLTKVGNFCFSEKLEPEYCLVCLLNNSAQLGDEFCS